MRPVSGKPKEKVPMKEHTVKLSGHAKDRFLERFFAEEPELDPAARERLLTRSKSAMTSLRVRKAVLSGARRVPARTPSAAPAPISPAEAISGAAPSPSAPENLQSISTPVATAAPAPEPPAAAEPTQAPAQPKPFDAYAVKLVPVFQREGRDGLLTKLGEIAEVGHLRVMAKAQQIVLPQALRSGEADVQAVRDAIVEAVAKRIADRRAAAG